MKHSELDKTLLDAMVPARVRHLFEIQTTVALLPKMTVTIRTGGQEYPVHLLMFDNHEPGVLGKLAAGSKTVQLFIEDASNIYLTPLTELLENPEKHYYGGVLDYRSRKLKGIVEWWMQNYEGL